MLETLKLHQRKFLFTATVLVVGFFCFILLYRLGIHPFIDMDESIYAQVAKESFLNNQYFDLTYFDKPWYEKPPVTFWLISISYMIGGINEWAARMPSVLMAIATVILSLRWTYELRKSYTTVLLAAACYFLMNQFITSAYFVNVDNIVGFFILLALYSWWKSIKNSKWFIVWGAAIGLGLMTKNIVGFFPMVPIAIYSLISWNFKFFKERNFWLGILALILISAPWHIYQSIIAGKEFWNNYLFYHVIRRYGTSLEGNGAPFLYYFELVFQRYPEALIVFIGSLLHSIWASWKDEDVRYLVISALVIFLIFSCSTTKIYSYISVILPVFVMLAGLTLAKLISYIPKKWMQGLVAAILIMVFVFTGYSFNTYKLAKGEYTEEYLDNQAVGRFLKDYHRDLPVYNNFEYKNLAIGFYADREIIPTEDQNLINKAAERVLHKYSQEVYLGDGYIMIKRWR